jgi:intein-encoded DNA endonuclease-like protein
MKRLTNSERNKIVNLAKSGVSLNKLSKISGRSKSTLYYHVQNFIRKNPNVELSLLTEWERGYLLGLFFGDGNLDFRKSSYQYRVVFNFNRKTEMPIVKRLMTMLEKCGCRPYLGLFKNKANKNLARVVCLSKVLYEFLNKFVVYKKKLKAEI